MLLGISLPVVAITALAYFKRHNPVLWGCGSYGLELENGCSADSTVLPAVGGAQAGNAPIRLFSEDGKQ